MEESVTNEPIPGQLDIYECIEMVERDGKTSRPRRRVMTVREVVQIKVKGNRSVNSKRAGPKQR